jgi:hypothetical protein
MYWLIDLFVYLFIYCMNLQALGDLEQVESVRSPGSYIPSNGEVITGDHSEGSAASSSSACQRTVSAGGAAASWKCGHSMINKCTDAVCRMNRIPLIGWFGWSSRELCDWNFKASHYFCRIPDCHMMALAGTFLRRETPAPSCAKLLEHLCRKWKLLPTVRR